MLIATILYIFLTSYKKIISNNVCTSLYTILLSRFFESPTNGMLSTISLASITNNKSNNKSKKELIHHPFDYRNILFSSL